MEVANDFLENDDPWGDGNTSEVSTASFESMVIEAGDYFPIRDSYDLWQEEQFPYGSETEILHRGSGDNIATGF